MVHKPGHYTFIVVEMVALFEDEYRFTVCHRLVANQTEELMIFIV